jgi:UBA/TS-N domain
MEAVSEENVETLCCMGFVREQAKQALRIAKNDLNEAVAILTGDHPTAGFESLYGLDCDQYEESSKSSGSSSGTLVYGPSLPPSYDEVVEDASGSRVSTPLFLFKHDAAQAL